jgi:glycosyltransferase involved in cell wall biosynthesis
MWSDRTLAEPRSSCPGLDPGVGEHARQDASLGDALIHAAVCWRGDGLSNPTAPFQMAGRDVAAASFTAAIALHGKMAAADFFAPQADLEACRQQIEAAIAAGNGDRAQPLSIFHEVTLPGRMADSPYDVLHGPTDFPRLSYFRSRFSDRVFPITGTSMGLSYSFDIHRYYLRLLAAEFYPCDALVCPTRSAVSALEKRLLDLAERFARAWEGRLPALPQLQRIPWGVDTDRFAPRGQAMARRDLELPAQRPLLLCVGRMNLHDKMDLAPLLLAFEGVCRMAKERPLLVLAGAPSDYEQRVLVDCSRSDARNSLTFQ